METKRLPRRHDCLAPDGSEIRLLAATSRGSCVHCTLAPGAVSLAVTHRTVDEIWYFLRGSGEVWRKFGDREEVVEVAAGMCLTIPCGAHFQFRNTGRIPLRFVLVTMPPWPGEVEAVLVPDYWPVDPAEPVTPVL